MNYFIFILTNMIWAFVHFSVAPFVAVMSIVIFILAAFIVAEEGPSLSWF